MDESSTKVTNHKLPRTKRRLIHICKPLSICMESQFCRQTPLNLCGVQFCRNSPEARIVLGYRTTSTENKMEQKSKTVMVAVDESEESMNALLWACKYLLPAQCPHGDSTRQQICKFSLVHVQPETSFAAGPAYIVSEDVVNLMEMEASRTTQKIFKRALCICRDNNVEAETQVFVGEVKQRLCEAAGKLGADFLVMGSHSHGFFKRVIVGSLSDYCCQNSACPVVVVNKNVCNNKKRW